MLIYAIVTITLALVFYTIGVWSEKIQGSLKKWHLVIFWIGLAFDTIGTTLMSNLSGNSFQFNFHGITGLLAIILMIFHAVWATVVLVKKDENMKLNFHKFSLLVWLIWLVPFLSGMIFAMK
ncbi:HsmA family protein [Clostridium grantii]|uniref:TIGR03987 family protein n=1 Tax=Clostridium grantii DSM 8605 TaxID=1121316 RepID=A0A1M5T711_9CLOT|nr:HsmA family protein [Clostridium grantii]SHH46519.1 TIGR03987 family protein [Clostridium grantii DSM 8605]